MATKTVIVDGNIYEIDVAARTIIVGAGQVFESSVAAGGPTYTLTVTNATLTHTGKSVDLTASRIISASPATLTFSGQSVGMNVTRVLSVSPATLTLSGQAVDLSVSRIISVSPATLTFSGQSVDMTYTPAAGPTYTLSVSPATLTYTGNSVEMVASRVLSVSPATLTFSGQSVTMTAVFADIIEIYKSANGHVFIENSAGPFYPLDMLVASDSGDNVTVTDSLTGVEIISGRPYGEFRQDGGAAHGASAAAVVTALTTEFNT